MDNFLTNSLSRFGDIKSLIVEAEQEGLMCQPVGLSGLSGEKLVGALQRLAKYQADASRGCYLEVGVFQGLTLISTAVALAGKPAYGIDNFSLDPDSRNRKIVADRIAANSGVRVEVIDSDFEDALANLSSHLRGEKVGLFFVDGPHDYRSQILCLELVRPHLSETGIIVVDDCNYPHVRLANGDFLKSHPEFALFYQAYTGSHPNNMSPGRIEEVRSGWWNGVNVLIRDPEQQLGTTYPQVEDDRGQYVDQHVVLSEKYSQLSPQALSLVTSIADLHLLRASKQALDIWRSARRLRVSGHAGEYPSMNTWSDQLTAGEFNPGLSEVGAP